MNQYIMLTLLSLISLNEINGRSWIKDYSKVSSHGDRSLILENSGMSSELRIQNSESRKFDNKQLQNWDSGRIWFPDFNEKHFSSGNPFTKPIEVGSTSFPREVNECIRQCPRTTEYNPVCGTDRVTYGNVGKLECARSCGVDVDILRKLPCSIVFQEPSTTQITGTLEDEQQRCIKSCPTTPEYNPVCGTNRVTYLNRGKLECAKLCGVDVDVKRLSPCPKPIRTLAVSSDDENLFKLDNAGRVTSTSYPFTSSTVAPDIPNILVSQEILNEIFNTSASGSSSEDDIEIRQHE